MKGRFDILTKLEEFREDTAFLMDKIDEILRKNEYDQAICMIFGEEESKSIEELDKEALIEETDRFV